MYTISKAHPFGVREVLGHVQIGPSGRLQTQSINTNFDSLIKSMKGNTPDKDFYEGLPDRIRGYYTIKEVLPKATQ